MNHGAAVHLPVCSPGCHSSLGHPQPSVFQAPEAFSPWGRLSHSLCLFSLGKDFAPEFPHPFSSRDSGSSPELQDFILDG